MVCVLIERMVKKGSLSFGTWAKAWRKWGRSPEILRGSDPWVHFMLLTAQSLLFYRILEEKTGHRRNIVSGDTFRFNYYFLKFFFIFNWRITALQYCVGFAINQHESTIGIHMSPPSWTCLPSPPTSHPSRLSQNTGFELPVSYSKLLLLIYFTYGNVYISVLLS